MKRAVELFALEARSSRSPLVEETWQTRSEPEEFFMSVAATHWEMVVTWQRGAARLTVRGPETRATIVAIPRDAEFFGVQFSLGTFMPGLPPGRLVDRTWTLPQVTGSSFWFDGSVWEVPGPDTADVFVHRLAHAGLLVHDPDRLCRPAPLDQIAPALRRADALSDRGLRAVWIVVAGVQDGMSRVG